MSPSYDGQSEEERVICWNNAWKNGGKHKEVKIV